MMSTSRGKLTWSVCLMLGLVVPGASALAASVIVDNRDGGFGILLGSWVTGSLPSSDPWPTDGTGDYRYISTVSGSYTGQAQWRPDLPASGTYNVYVWYGAGGNRANNAPFAVTHATGTTTVIVNQQTNGGMWFPIGQYTFNAGNGGYVRLTNDAQAGKNVIADAVKFEEVAPPDRDLTMAVSPADAGTTTPAVGGPYPQPADEVVSIGANANAGYVFSHWTVSAGSAVGDPNAATTTVTMDQSKTVTAVFVSDQTQLTMTVSPPGAGTTTPLIGGPYTYALDEVVGISAAANEQYAFDHWEVSGGSAVADPNSAVTSVTMDQSKTITAVFVSTAPRQLSMVVTPIGAGTTTPAAGGPYSYSPDDVVGISASANPGYVFSHWTTTAGTAAAAPTSASTTVTMDQSKSAIAVFKSTAVNPGEIRALWAVVFQQGYKTSAQVDTMIAAAVAGNYNVIIAQMLAYQDSGTPSHGAYWNSSIVPKATDITPSSFDPLDYLCTQAHANGIEVHAMSVPFRMCTSWPPANNATLQQHPEWFSVNQANMGCIIPEPLANGIIVLDPGNPDAQEYLLSIMREMLANYPIDGIHWDLEYVSTGYYPTNVDTPNSTLARFKQITGYTGTPDPTYGPWQDFRRRVNDEFIARAHAEILGYCTPTRQIRQSASLIQYGDIEANFTDSESYREFNNWEMWTRMGFLDTAIPMNYDREHVSSQKQYFRNCIPQENIWKNDRELVPGIAIYLNYFWGSIDQINYCRSVGTEGTAHYDYWYTTTDGTSTIHDTTWYTSPSGVQSVFTAPADLPTMKWRDPATATEGTVWGQVTDGATGLPVDDATVQVGSLAPVQTDGNGYYVVAMANATSAGTEYTITAGKSGLPTVTHEHVQVVAGTVSREDIVLATVCTLPPIISTQPQPKEVCAATNTVFAVGATGCPDSPLSYQWQKDSVDLDDGGRYSGVYTPVLNITGVDATCLGTYRCIVTAAEGSTASDGAALGFSATIAPDLNNDCVVVDQADVLVFLSCLTGPDALYAGAGLPDGCMLTPDAQGYVAADFDRDGDIDQGDFGRLQRCLSETFELPDPQCAN